jgi:hypothetical protein
MHFRRRRKQPAFRLIVQLPRSPVQDASLGPDGTILA